MTDLDDIVRGFERAVAHPGSPLHFTPVKVRARFDGWTPERQRTFVAALAATGNAGRAAAHVGMSPKTATRLAARPDGQSFARACQNASTLAARFRLRAAAARAEGSEGPEGPKGFSLKGSALSQPSAPFRTFRADPRHAKR